MRRLVIVPYEMYINERVFYAGALIPCLIFGMTTLYEDIYP